MPLKRPRIRKDGLRDNRSRPKLKECPPHEQRYILRRISKKGLGKVVVRWEEGYKPTVDDIYQFLAERKWFKYTYVLMSTRPRPKHVLTSWWEESENRGLLEFRYREADR